MKTYIIADLSNPPTVPTEIAKCGYCHAQVYITEIDEMSEDENGDWIVENVKIECTNEPEPREGETDDDYENRLTEWWISHSDMPYVNILPVEETVKEWLNENYRFVDGEKERALLERWKKNCGVSS